MQEEIRREKADSQRKRKEDNWSACVDDMRQGYTSWVQTLTESIPGPSSQSETETPSSSILDLEPSKYDFDVEVYDILEGSSYMHFRQQTEDSQSGVISLVARGYVPVSPVSFSSAVSIETLEMFRWITQKTVEVSFRDCSKVLCGLHQVSLTDHARMSWCCRSSRLRYIPVQKWRAS